MWCERFRDTWRYIIFKPIFDASHHEIDDQSDKEGHSETYSILTYIGPKKGVENIENNKKGKP